MVGLTATPQRRDGHDPILTMQLGPLRFTVDPRGAAGRRPFAHRLIVREPAFVPEGLGEDAPIQTVYAALAADERRNALIAGDVLAALADGRTPVLLTERRDHLEQLAERLGREVRHLVVLHGGLGPKARREALARLANVPEGEPRLLLATGRCIGEGFDDARITIQAPSPALPSPRQPLDVCRNTPRGCRARRLGSGTCLVTRAIPHRDRWHWK